MGVGAGILKIYIYGTLPLSSKTGGVYGGDLVGSDLAPFQKWEA